MATNKRSPAYASIPMTKRALNYGHLLQQLPKGYESQSVINRKRRRTPDINDAPLSSSDEDSNSVNDDKIDNNANNVSSSGWRQPQEYVSTGQETSNNGVGGKSSTTFRPPPTGANGIARRRSTRVQGSSSSPKRSRDTTEPSDDDNILDEFGQMRSSQGQSRPKKMRVYGPPAVNIHGVGNVGRAQTFAKGSNAVTKSKNGATDGFRIPDLEAMEEKREFQQRAL